MAQKIVVLITKKKSFTSDILWENLRSSLACNGDRVFEKDVDSKYNEAHMGGIYAWEFPNDLPYRYFYSIHEAPNLGWKLLAPAIKKQSTNIFGGADYYEWWLVRDD